MVKLSVALKVLVLLGCWALCCHSKPMGGKFDDVIYSTGAKVIYWRKVSYSY